MNTLEGIRDALGDIGRQDFPALNLHPGPWSYRVGAVRADGRCDLVAVKKGPPPELPNVDHWSASGAASKPTAGSIVVVSFLDGDPGSPMIGAYEPLRFAGGAPTEATLDATTIKIGPTSATLIELGGSSAGALALASLVSGNFTTIGDAVAAAVVVPGDGGAALKAALTTAFAALVSMATTKVKGA